MGAPLGTTMGGLGSFTAAPMLGSMTAAPMMAAPMMQQVQTVQRHVDLVCLRQKEIPTASVDILDIEALVQYQNSNFTQPSNF